MANPKPVRAEINEAALLRKAFLEETLWVMVAVIAATPFLFSIVFAVFAPAVGVSVYFTIQVIRNFRAREAKARREAPPPRKPSAPARKGPYHHLFQEAAKALTAARRKVAYGPTYEAMGRLMTVLRELRKRTDEDERAARYMRREMQRRLPLLTSLAQQYAALAGTARSLRDKTAMAAAERAFVDVMPELNRLLEMDFAKFDFLRMEADAELLIEAPRLVGGAAADVLRR